MPDESDETIYNNSMKIINYFGMTDEEFEAVDGPVLEPDHVVREFTKLLNIVKKNKPHKFDLAIIRGLCIVTDNKYLRIVRDAASLVLQAYKDRKEM